MLKGKPLFALVAVLLNTLLLAGLVLAIGPTGLFSSRAVAEGLLRLELSVAPEVLRPGESTRLELHATNQGNRAAQPVITFDLPPNVTFAQRDIPSGTTLNLQTGQMIWRPVLAAGETGSFSLPLRVSVAEVQQPLQRVTATMRVGQIEQALSAEFWSGLPAQGQIRGVEQVSIGQPIQLYAQIEGPGPIEQEWDLGDGRVFQADNPFVAFPSAGDHTVTLTVANPLGRTRSTRVVRVVPEPAALFSPDDPTPGVDQAITFQNQSGGAGPLRYSWEFGDGAVSSLPTPEHRYAAAGSYQVRLTVENDFGSHSMTLPLTVGLPPQAAIEPVSQGKVGTPLPLRALGDSDVTAWRWELGDGRRANGATIEHIYQQPGDYTLTLFADNAYGTTIVTQTVTIEQGMLALFLPFLPHTWLASGDSGAPADAERSESLRLIDFQPIDLSAAVAPADSTPEERLLWYINKARETLGLPELAYSDALSRAAKRHTNDMAFNQFRGHTGSDGSRPAERQTAAGYSGFYGGEATGWGYPYPSRMVEFWLNSPDHRGMILSQYANEVGVAFTYDEDAPSIYYWTAEFGFNPDRPRGPIVLLETPAAAEAPTTAEPPTPVVIVAELPITATLVATATVAVTPTAPLPIVTLPPATAVPTATLPAATLTLTPTLAAPTATPTATASPTALPPLPTQTPTATPTATPSPTGVSPIVTATPVGAAPSATPSATATAGPSPTTTLAPSPTPTAPRIIVGTPVPTPTAAERDASGPVGSARAFIDALLADGQGLQAFPYATYAMQNRLTNAGSLATLQLAVQPTRYQLGPAVAVAEGQQVMADFWLPSGSQVQRQLLLRLIEGQWRVDAIALPPQ